MSKYKLIKENWDKYLQEEEEVEEQPVEEAEEPEQLDELQLPGVAWFMRSYQWLAPMFSILSQHDLTPGIVKPILEKIAKALTSFKQMMEDFEKKHKKTYYLIMSPIIAADVGGAATGKAKEYVLEKILANMQKEASADSAEEEPEIAVAKE